VVRRQFFAESHPACLNPGMANPETVGMSYGALRKECLEAVRQWPGCETVSGIQIIRENSPGGFSLRVTLFGKADKKTLIARSPACCARSDGIFT
jgi:hypothetical protein